MLSCAPTVYSPHAQNEMFPLYNRSGAAHEIGGAFAYNHWVVEKYSESIYIKTYPTASLSLFYNASYAWGGLSGIGGAEFIGFNEHWTVPDASGSVLLVKPYLGLQFSAPMITFRLNFSPLVIRATFGGDDGLTGTDLGKFTSHQFTILLHNVKPSTHTYWGGIRYAPRAIGFVGGYECALTKSTFLRAEYSYLGSPNILFTVDPEEDEIRGSVHYLTLGIFTRLK